MTMLDKAIAFLNANPGSHTLSTLRRATGIALRSQYRLSEQLKADDRVFHHGSNVFSNGMS